MSEKIIKFNKGGEGTNKGSEENFALPNNGKVYSADWTDDIAPEEEGDNSNVIGFETFKEEANYNNSESITSKPENLGMAKNEILEFKNKIGQRVLYLYENVERKVV